MQNKSKPQILVVDDEIRIRESIKGLLTQSGFEIYTACSVKESLELAKQISFDLFLVDKNLPQEDGFVLMDYILKEHPNVPFIVITGNASIDSAILALRKGAYDYLKKPFTYDELTKVISHALAQKKLEDENKVIAAMLKDSERRYREMIQNSPDLIIILDGYGCINFINNTVVSILGYTIEEIKGIPLLNIIDEKYREPVRSFLELPYLNRDCIEKSSVISQDVSVRDSGIDVEIICSPSCGSNKKRVDIEIRKSSISFNNRGLDGDSRVKEICIVGRDISFRKSFEQQMIYSQKMEAVALLAGGVAHDFNNLLMGIKGYVSVIKSKLDTDHSCYNHLIAIEKNVIKGSGVISQLLNFARGGVSNIQTANINFIIKDTLELFSINKKNIQVHLELSKDIWKVEVDTGQMEQVFLNMFINSHHAMKKGGDIFIKTENVMVNPSDAKIKEILPGAYVKVTIRDTGEGIEKSNQKKIFDPFFTTKKSSKGTGLGLASAYGIIKKHNGIVTVASSPGEGAIFTIYLCAKVINNSIIPKVNPVNISVRLTDRSSGELSNKNLLELPNKNHAITALIIDSEPVVQIAAVDMLKNIGINTIASSNGREGVQKYIEYMDEIDLVILDMVMPGMNGFETFKYIRKLNPQAKILMTSAYNHGDEITRIFSEGYCDFISKPYHDTLLYNRIESLLSPKNGLKADSICIAKSTTE